jgi:formyltetrahydrofolate deformylase
MTKSSPKEFILKATCSAKGGIVAAVTNYLWSKSCYISELNQFDDSESDAFFMRAVCQIEAHEISSNNVEQGFADIAKQFDMHWTMHDTTQPVKVLIMVSKFDHCLDNLLYRLRKGELDMDVTTVVSNHINLRGMVEREGIRFIHLPINKDNKAMQEQALLDIVKETQTELVVLARYMQILSDNLCTQLSGKIINIHHSFLPSFKGAKPYHQAYERGVKLIGATAHYVTADLDEGPIIEQAVQTVDHSYTPNMLTAIGRDTETVALARAVCLHVNHRVFLNDSKTVIFR